MDEAKNRERIQHKLQSEILPKDMGSLIVGGDGASGQSCAACGEAIKPSDVTPVAYEYASGKRYWFHKRCEEIWQEERFKVRPRS
ncbi:MAG: hypothetical protein ACREQ2_08485 [Candidatus Binatia bacterium]